MRKIHFNFRYLSIQFYLNIFAQNSYKLFNLYLVPYIFFFLEMLFEEGSRTLTIYLPDLDKTIKIDSVPQNIKSSKLFSRLDFEPFKINPVKQEFEIKCGKQIIGEHDAITENEIEVRIIPKNAHFYSLLFLLLFFFFTHVLALYFFITFRSYQFQILAYIILILIYSLFFRCIKPDVYSISLTLKTNIKDHPIFEFFVLFIKSLSPSFELEQILLDN